LTEKVVLARLAVYWFVLAPEANLYRRYTINLIVLYWLTVIMLKSCQEFLLQIKKIFFFYLIVKFNWHYCVLV